MKVTNFVTGKYSVLKPVSFIVTVLDAELTATVIDIVDHPVQNELVIKFSDGYTDTFSMTEEGNVTVANRYSGKHYAAALTADMQMLGLINGDELIWCITHSINDKLSNVWIRRYKRDAGVHYSVFYHGDYYFHVKQENGGWISETTRQTYPQPINEAVAAAVIKLVAKEHLVIPFNMV